MQQNDPLYGCYGKQAFKTYNEGKRAFDRIRKFNIHGRGHAELYRCPHCRNWHLGGRR
jgi:hypothetical protein